MHVITTGNLLDTILASKERKWGTYESNNPIVSFSNPLSPDPQQMCISQWQGC